MMCCQVFFLVSWEKLSAAGKESIPAEKRAGMLERTEKHQNRMQTLSSETERCALQGIQPGIPVPGEQLPDTVVTLYGKDFGEVEDMIPGLDPVTK